MEWVSIAALCVSLVMLLMTGGIHIFGGGRGLSDRFGKLEKAIHSEISELRKEIGEKQSRSETNVGDALNGIRQRMHDLELAAERQRANGAETYMRRDSYYKASEELKKDMNAGFDRLERRLDRVDEKIDEGNGHAAG